MSSQENETQLRRGYNAFNAGDMATLTEVFSPDAVWHVPGRNPLSGEKRGRDAVFAYFGKLGELSNGTFHVDLHDIVANERHLVGVQTDTAERAGKKLNARAVLLFHMEGGKITEGWENFEDQYAVDAFLA